MLSIQPQQELRSTQARLCGTVAGGFRRVSALSSPPSTLDPRPSTRLGFTLIELLVVTGIIIFLVAISVAVSMTMLGKAKERATGATIRKVHELMQQRM